MYWYKAGLIKKIRGNGMNKVIKLIFLCLIILAVFSCGKKTEDSDPNDMVFSEDSENPEDLTAEDVHPDFRVSSSGGNLPSSVKIYFNRDIVSSDEVKDKINGDTIINFSPSVRGTWIWYNPGTLQFTPSDGFSHSKNISIVIKQLQSPNGPLFPSDPEEWSYQFRTSPLKIKNTVLQSFNVKNWSATLLISSTGPLSVSSLQKNSQILIGGKSAGRATAAKAAGENRYTLYIQSNLMQSDRNMKLTVSDKLTSENGSSRLAETFENSYTLKEPEPMTVEGFNRKEGTSGYYIEVYLRDEADSRNRRYWQNFADIDSDIAEDFITLKPSVDFTVSPTSEGFRIFGDFRRGSYEFILNSGLYSRNGGLLKKTYKKSVTIPARTPSISFLSKGRYLPKDYIRYLPVSHMNISSLDVEVRQIHEQNIGFWLSANSEWADDRISDLVGSKKIRLKNTEDTSLNSWIDMTQLLPENRKGVFQIGLKGGNVSDYARLILTDLAVIAKKYGPDKKNYSIWVLDVTNLKPVSGAEVEIMTLSNRSLLTVSTNSSGYCKIENLEDMLSENEAFSIFVRKGEDLTVLKFDDIQVVTDEYNVHGLPYQLEVPYQASIYSDSGVYRPGNTANISVVIRDENDKAPPEGLPLIAQIYDPQRKLIKKLKGNTNEAGMAQFSIEFQAYANTGKYGFDLLIGAEKVESYEFNVEEFVPERMKVNLNTAEESYMQQDSIPVSIDAMYLFGAAASGEKVEISYVLSEGIFRPANNFTYSYGVWRKTPFRDLSMGTSTANLDSEGKVEILAPDIASFTNFNGPGEMIIQASVFESGSGRTTVNQLYVPVHPNKHYIGLSSASDKASSGEETEIKGILVDLDGNPVNVNYPVEITLFEIQSEWIWEYDSDFGRGRYHRYMREMELGKSLTEIKDSQFIYKFKGTSRAEGYVIQASAADNMITSIMLQGDSFNSYYYWRWWGDTGYSRNDNTSKPVPPEVIPISIEGSIRAGENSTAMIYPPYPGKVLVTIETDDLIKQEWVDAGTGPIEYKFKVKDFYPNVYISALLVRETMDNTERVFLPGRAFGVTSVKMEPVNYKLVPVITVPDEIEPKSELVVELDIGKQQERTYATVAVVDEGILQLTRFKTPDPLISLFKQRSLGVDTFETIGWTLRIPPMTEDNSAGDRAGQDNQRVMPVETVILNSGIVEIPESGKVKIKFNIPEYRGQLRVMVVTANATRSGSADSYVTVTEPIVAQATIPRFLMAEDSMSIPVFITNLSGKKTDINVEFTANNAIKVSSSARQKISLANNASGTVAFDCEVIKDIGAAYFTINISGNGYKTTTTGQAPIRPNAPITTETHVVELKKGETELSGIFNGWKPQYEKTTIWITANKYADELSHLKYLIRYPYGCIEQTTSGTRPLLYIANIFKHIAPELAAESNIEEKFMHGANRLLSMQTAEGGFSYWPGATAPTYWGTAYASHCLLLGLKMGYPIPEDRLNEAFDFMETTLDGDTTLIDRKYGYSVEKSEPYMQYVLALAGRPRKGRILQLIKNPRTAWKELTDESIYLLKAALYLAGDRTYEKDLKKIDSNITLKRTNGWSFWSALRSRGMMLEVYEELFPGGAEGSLAADKIAAKLQGNSRYFTTQELSWCVSSLGKRVNNMASSFGTPTLIVDGKKMDASFGATSSGGFTFEVSGASGYSSITVDIPSIKGGSLFAVINIEGIKPGVDFEYGNKGIRVDRKYFNADGDAVSIKNISFGALVYVELSLKNLTGAKIQNIALVDRFPAGFEIENPRLNRLHTGNWFEENKIWDIDYMNLRDDRIELFGHVKGNAEVKMYYVLRNVTAGSFTLPPVKAEAMYDPAIWSQKAGYGVVSK